VLLGVAVAVAVAVAVDVDVAARERSTIGMHITPFSHREKVARSAG
jgi:hypothetical protein